MGNFKSEFYFTAFKKLKKAYLSFAQDELKTYSLSPNEIEVVSFLKGKSCGSEIAREFDVSKTLVSRSVSYLLKKELIKVENGTVDKREKILSLTEKGKQLAEEIENMKDHFFTKALKHFEDREKQVLEALLKLLLRNISEIQTV